VCTADADGMIVSLIQSNWMGFGSGLTVPGWGINLHNRGAAFSLDPAHVNAIAPAKRTLHTLIPALVLRESRPWLAFGTMGGHGQAQTHVQLLARFVDDGEDLQRAIDAPRWIVSPSDWSVTAEARLSSDTLDGLTARGHRVVTTEPLDSLMGHAHAILVSPDGYTGATDPRTEGAVLGL
jgi:gamma-glutamyltranspeptidase/glutathione hydrolase